MDPTPQNQTCENHHGFLLECKTGRVWTSGLELPAGPRSQRSVTVGTEGHWGATSLQWPRPSSLASRVFIFSDFIHSRLWRLLGKPGLWIYLPFSSFSFAFSGPAACQGRDGTHRLEFQRGLVIPFFFFFFGSDSRQLLGSSSGLPWSRLGQIMEGLGLLPERWSPP